MATIRPFKSYRPSPGFEQKVAALPYDVYNREEATQIVAKNPQTFLAIDRPETQFGPEVDTYAPEVYLKAKEMIWEQIEQGIFKQEEKPCFYLYQQVMNGRSQTGIVACASIDDYLNNVIKKHENTRADKEKDRISHVDTCNVQTGPIFLAYRNNEILKQVMNTTMETKPVNNFESEDGIIHKVWIMDNPEHVKKVSHAFEQLNEIYIADGHHRCASAVRVGLNRREANPNYTGEEEFNYFLSVLFQDEELYIMDYNRVIKDLNGLSKDEFLKEISIKFDVVEKGTQCYRPIKKGTFGMYLEDIWYELTVKASIGIDDVVGSLDVSVLQDNILKPTLGIEDPKTDERIDFVGGIRGLEELERRVHSDMKVAFSMYPTSIGELFAVADADRLMPPKSTWFEPKLRSGLFLHSLQE